MATVETIRVDSDVSGAISGFERLQSVGTGALNSIQRAGSGLTSMGQSLALATAPVGLGFAAVGKIAGDFENSMQRLQAISGATGEQFEQLRNQAKELGASTEYSAKQAADAQNFLAMAGFDVNEVVTAMPGLLDLATAGQLDLARAADISSNILTGYGYAATDIGYVNDVLAKTATAANTNIEQLGEAMKYAAPIAKSAGIEFTEAAAIIGKLSDAGLQGSMAGTSLRGALSRLLKPTKETRETLDKLGVTVLDSSGDLRSLTSILGDLEAAGATTADMLTIFGQEAGTGMSALLGQGSNAVQELKDKLDAANGSATKMADTMRGGLQGQAANLQSALEGLAIEIGDTGLLEIMGYGIELLTKVVQKIAALPPPALKVVTVMGLLAVAIPPILIGLGVLISSVATVGAALGSVSFGAIFTGISLLTTAFGFFYRNSESFRSAIKEGIDIQQVFIKTSETVGRIVGRVTGMLIGFLENYRPILEDLGKRFLSFADNAMAAIGQAVLAALPTIELFINNGLQFMADAMDMVGDAFMSGVHAVRAFKIPFDEILPAIGMFAAKAFEIGRTVLRVLVDGFIAAREPLAIFAKGVWDTAVFLGRFLYGAIVQLTPPLIGFLSIVGRYVVDLIDFVARLGGLMLQTLVPVLQRLGAVLLPVLADSFRVINELLVAIFPSMDAVTTDGIPPLIAIFKGLLWVVELAVVILIGLLHVLNQVLSFLTPFITGFAKLVTFISQILFTIVANIGNWGVQLWRAGWGAIGNFFKGIGAGFDGGIAWFKGQLKRLRDLLPGSEPKDGSSPLAQLGQAGTATLQNFAGGLSAAPAIASLNQGLGAVRDALTVSGSVAAGQTLAQAQRAPVMTAAVADGGGGEVVYNPTYNINLNLGGAAGDLSRQIEQAIMQALENRDREVLDLIDRARQRWRRG